MSIICTTYVPEGIVLAADSRLSLNMNFVNKEDNSKTLTHIFPMSDHAQKIVLLNKVQAGIAVGGNTVLDNMTIPNYIRDFEMREVNDFDSVCDIADKLCAKTEKFGKAITIHVAGYNENEPFFYSISNGECKRLNIKGFDIQYGITWSGEVSTLQKLMMTEPKLALDFKVFPILDAVEFTEFLVNTAIKLQQFEMKPKTCGGPIDILVLTPDGAVWYQHKLFDRTFIPSPLSQRSGIKFGKNNSQTIN